MRALDWIAGKLGYKKSAGANIRMGGFDAAELGRLTASLRSESEFINTTLRYQLRILRARSRQAAQNNPYARRFIQMCVDNIAGPNPFRLEAKARVASGKFDVAANRRIEAAHREWSRPGNCEFTGRWSWNACRRLLVRNLAVDGELMFRVLRGPEYGPYGLQVQILDVDRLYEMKNKALPGGGAIHAGVEVDSNGKPVAYHLLKRKPAQWQAYGISQECERIPADEVFHIFIPEFAEQIRGVPWMYAALLNLVHMGAFEEAAVIAARVGASQMGVIQSPDGGASFVGDGKNQQGQPQINAEPGSFPMLPPGYTLQSWDPKYPDAAVGPFIKAMVRGIASGVGVAYHNLANDLEGVNYSSARIGEMDERDSWMVLQNHFVEHLEEPFYSREWLRAAVLASKLPFKIDRLDKYREVIFRPRRWAWVDPAKEIKAHIDAIDNKLASRTRVIAEGGEDIEDVFDELKLENQMLKDRELDAKAPAAPAPTPAPTPPAPDDEATETED